MARPLRIEFPSADYHVTSRGDRREDIFVDDVDRQDLLKVVAQAFSRFDTRALADCLMGNHYHTYRACPQCQATRGDRATACAKAALPLSRSR